jgi:CheY-like chemotaxis protein
MRGPILLVEDNEDDVFFLQRAMKSAALNYPLIVAKDGQQAIDYLSGAKEFSDRAQFPVPALVLLDIKLPKVHGLDVLKWIRAESSLQTLVVIMLTTSHLEVDVDRAYRLGANSFLVKTPSSEKLERLLRLIHDYWLQLNHPPPRSVTPNGEQKQ